MTSTVAAQSTPTLGLARYFVFEVSTCAAFSFVTGLFIQFDPPYIWNIVTFFCWWTFGTLYAAWLSAKRANDEDVLGPAIMLYGTILFPVVLAVMNFDAVHHDLMTRSLVSGLLLLVVEGILFAGAGFGFSFVLYFWLEQYREEGAAKTIWHSIVILWAGVLILSLVLGTLELVKRLGNDR
jgi:hypothetical protein